MTNFKPTLFWLTGLSGAGKTTLGILLTKKLRDRGCPVVFLDGDTLREIYNNRFGHDREGRLEASLQYARLCKMLTEQKVHVVCATISMFHQTQDWNRENIKNYVEVFVDVPLEELIKRDSKHIYSKAKAGELKNIVGIDIEPELPKKADIIIKNYNNSAVEDNVSLILETYDARIYLKENIDASNVELYQTS
ncbi:MAG: Adenylyl-sulfate kinase [uncultured bacterium]|nr:MAG: Adenylyl-sulfate kinase [uncultured bacterium]